jgi:hypothetical protein
VSLGADIAAGRAYVELLLKDESFRARLKNVSTTMAAWGRGLRTVGYGISGVGAAILSPFIASLPMFVKSGARIKDLGDRLSAPIDDMQRLSFAFEQTGTNLEENMSNLVRFQKELAKSGKSGKDLAGALFQIADQIQAIEDPAKRMELLLDKFGKGGASMMPLFAGGSAEMQKLFDRADRLGIVMKPSDIEAAAKMDDTFAELRATMAAFGNTLAAAVIPYLQPLLEMAVKIVSGITQWIDKHRALAVGLAATGVALLAFGGLVIVLGTAFAVIATAIGGFTAVLTFVATPIGMVVVAIGALIAGIAALTALIVTATGQWENLWTALEGYASYTLASLNAILEFMLSGDWKNAGKTMALAIAAGISEVPGIAELFNIAGLGDMKKQLDEAIKQADAARKAREAANPAKPRPGFPDLGDALGAANAAARPMGALGFMNAGQARAFGAGSKNVLGEKQLQALKDIDEGIKRLPEKIRPRFVR